MFESKDSFIVNMQEVGKIDAYLSIARLYKKHAQQHNARYSFVNYIDNATTPYINIENAWHPILNPDTVVTNSIELGKEDKARKAIITGPNAGGKSTVLKSITIAILLAQTFGIAPATSMSITPFTLIDTYMNTADTEGKESLFQAEMRRTKDLLHNIDLLKPNEFSFVVMDEIFTGTNPKEGMAGAYGVSKKLSRYSNNISIIATHFMELTELEKDTNGQFENLKVSIIRNGNKIIFPYKLEMGVTDQAIALDLLAQEEFDADVLEAAQNILSR